MRSARKLTAITDLNKIIRALRAGETSLFYLLEQRHLRIDPAVAKSERLAFLTGGDLLSLHTNKMASLVKNTSAPGAHHQKLALIPPTTIPVPDER